MLSTRFYYSRCNKDFNESRLKTCYMIILENMVNSRNKFYGNIFLNIYKFLNPFKHKSFLRISSDCDSIFKYFIIACCVAFTEMIL